MGSPDAYIQTAREFLDQTHAAKGARRYLDAKKLAEKIAIATEPDEIVRLMSRLTDARFGAFCSGEPFRTVMDLEFEVLNDAAEKLGRSMIESATVRRTELREAQFARETKKHGQEAEARKKRIAAGAASPLAPAVLVDELRAIGMNLDNGWHRSNYDGIYTTVLRTTFADNEVSCLLESGDPTLVQRVELEAEFYVPGLLEVAMLQHFGDALAVLYPEAPEEMLEAVKSMRSWSGSRWKLERAPHARNGGFDLRLTYRPTN